MTCDKCGGLVVVEPDAARCIMCGRYWFPPDVTVERCSQGDGACQEQAGIDGLCPAHHRARLDMVNAGRRPGFRYRR